MQIVPDIKKYDLNRTVGNTAHGEHLIMYPILRKLGYNFLFTNILKF